MTALTTLVHRARFRAATRLSVCPALYYGVRRLGGPLDDLYVRRDTDIVIEGFPRSANSTTVRKFLERQNGPRRVAHHKHHAAQILRAIRWNLPTVVLIREPRAACLSLMALIAEARHRAGRPPISSLRFSDVLMAYITFYETVEPHLNRVVIGRFEAVVDDISPLIIRVNRQFSSDFSHNPLAATPQPQLGWHAMPNVIRDGIKDDLETSLAAALRSRSALRDLLARAQALHHRYGERNENAC